METLPIPNARPCLRWVGSKRRLLDRLLPLIPKDFAAYHEPFVGGGAVFFALASDPAVRFGAGMASAYLNDANRDLVAFYRALRDDFPQLRIEYERLAIEHSKSPSGCYEVMRQDEPSTPLERATRFLYLNRACFNGLWRVNEAGKFNVSKGDRDELAMSMDEAVNMRECARALDSVIITSKDFAKALFQRASRDDLVFVDPPYLPATDATTGEASKTSNFAGYAKDRFGLEEHRRLRSVLDDLDHKGAMVVLCAADTPWTREAYAGWDVVEVEARRSVSARGSSRGRARELIIRNPKAAERARS